MHGECFCICFVGHITFQRLKTNWTGHTTACTSAVEVGHKFLRNLAA